MYQRTDKLHDSFVKCSSIWFYLLSDSVIFEAGSGPQKSFKIEDVFSHQSTSPHQDPRPQVAYHLSHP